MRKKYYSLDIAKFAFTLMIAVYHMWGYYGVNARGGFVAVEFFFIMSGFFLMRQFEMQASGVTPVQYTWGKIKKYYPHYIFSFFAIFLFINIVEYDNGLTAILKNLFRQATGVFMLYGTILSDEKTFIYNSMTWYISVLLLVGYILWALLKKHRTEVMTAAPVIVFWIYAYMCYTLGTTNNWRTHVFEVFNYAVLRAVAGMLLGMLVYQAYSRDLFLLKNSKNGTWGGYIFIGFGILTVAFIASYRWFNWVSFFYIACFAIGILFLVAGEENSGRTLPKSIVLLADWMAGISYAIYLNHYLVFHMMRRYFAQEYHHWIIPVYLIILIVYSMLTAKIVAYGRKLLGRLRNP